MRERHGNVKMHINLCIFFCSPLLAFNEIYTHIGTLFLIVQGPLTRGTFHCLGSWILGEDQHRLPSILLTRFVSLTLKPKALDLNSPNLS